MKRHYHAVSTNVPTHENTLTVEVSLSRAFIWRIDPCGTREIQADTQVLPHGYV